MREALTYTTFPVVFGGGMLAAVVALDYGWSPAIVLAAISLVVAIVIHIMERVHPHVPHWNTPQGDVTTDAKHLVVSMMAVPELLKLALIVTLYPLGVLISEQVGATLWPSNWPLLAQCLLAVVVSEFGAYWAHRLMHENELLWRLHATHHSAPRLYWLNAARFHPLDTALQYLGHVIPLALMGCPEDTLMLLSLFTSLHGMFQHANIRMKLGPLNWFFSMAELHRWHHSTLIEEGNTNYGANCILWDIIFGTRFLPKDRDPPDTIGIGHMPNFPKGYLEHVLSPFNWDDILTQSQAESSQD